MTYDIYCYKPVSSQPDVLEAKRVLGAGYEYPSLERPADYHAKWKIAAALLRFDPSLEPWHINREKVLSIGVNAESKEDTDHIELGSGEGKPAIQIEIFLDNVGLSIPYWYTGTEVDSVFETVSASLRVIGETAGYFVYDPQKAVAYDPVKQEAGGRGVYAETSRVLPGIISKYVREEDLGKKEKDKHSTNEDADSS